MTKSKQILIAVFVLIVLHKDYWFWYDGSLIFGFLPIGLAYHAGISIAASLLWAGVVFYAWPEEIEKFAEEPSP